MRIRIGPAQAAWLAEIGVDAHWLGLLTEPPAPVARAASPPTTQPCASPAAGPDAPQLPAAPKAATPPLAPPAADAADGRSAPAAAPEEADRSRASTAALSDLEALERDILACETCGLHAGRTRAVPGAGRTEAPEYLIVGEMPGAADDAVGTPFEGQAGSLLRAMLAGTRLPRADSVYLTNVLKCRPPGGRAARAAEVAACLPHLRRQIEILRPRRILVLGRVAAQALLGTRATLDELRGHEHAYALSDGTAIGLWVTHHPASLLVRPALKAQAWADLVALARAVRGPAQPA